MFNNHPLVHCHFSFTVFKHLMRLIHICVKVVRERNYKAFLAWLACAAIIRIHTDCLVCYMIEAVPSASHSVTFASNHLEDLIEGTKNCVYVNSLIFKVVSLHRQ